MSDPTLADALGARDRRGDQPRVSITGGNAEAVSPVLAEGDPLGYKEPDDLTEDDECWLIRGWGLDPARWEIIPGTLGVNRWQGMTRVTEGTGASRTSHNELLWQHQYKARLRRRSGVAASPAEMASIVAELRRRPSRKSRVADVAEGDERYLVVCLSDLQAGKGEGGGTPALARRLGVQIARVREKIVEARRMGRPFAGVVALGMGDLIESCAGHYPVQTFTVDMDRRGQERFVRSVITETIDAVSDLVGDVLLMAVPGNHGENRNGDGKAYTNWTDNSDLATFECVFEALSVNPGRYPNVRLELPVEGDLPGQPHDPLVIVREVAGVRLGAHHGHAIRKPGHTIHKLEEWWRAQALGNRPVASADILVTGHLHHFVSSETTGRTVFQCPANDGGSYWWTVASGQSSPPGLLTFGIGLSYGARKWGDLEIIDAPRGER